MKAALERWLLECWYGGRPPGFGLRALAGLYHLALDARAASYRLGAQRARQVPARVLVVGNFVAGGAGKTPLVLALARRLADAGFRPAIISRGHGRASQAPVTVTADTPVADCGDEPKLMFERSGLPVFVDRDRAAAARRAAAAGCDLVIADDGLQHRRLARDVEIEVVDGERRYGNGLLLPAGPLREIPRRTDFRVVNGGQAEPGEWPMRLRLGQARSLGEAAPRPLADFAGRPVHAVAGIGNPRRFFAALRGHGLTVVEHAFPDHHAYVASDFAGLDGDVLMTEKDAVKCRGLGLGSAWSVPVDAEIDDDLFRQLIDRLRPAKP